MINEFDFAIGLLIGFIIGIYVGYKNCLLNQEEQKLKDLEMKE